MYSPGYLKIPSFSEIDNDSSNAIISNLARHGGVILEEEMFDNSLSGSDKLARIGAELGNPVLHKLSDSNGVHPIRVIPSYSEYANTTNADLNMHTDGAFEKTPPKIMLIYCEKPAETGGETRICNGLDIYRFVETFGQKALNGLFLSNAFYIKRDDRRKNSAVFKKEADKIQIRYRYGSDILVDINPQARRGFEAIEDFLAKPENYYEFKLQTNQIFIFDNTRVLHGRTSFDENSGRSLYGLWCDGKRLSSLDYSFGFEV